MELPSLRVYQLGREQASEEAVLTRALRQIPAQTALLLSDTDISLRQPDSDTVCNFTPISAYATGRNGSTVKGFGEMSVASTHLGSCAQVYESARDSR